MKETDIVECETYLLPNFLDELLNLTFREKYDAFAQPDDEYIPPDKRKMTDGGELREYLISATVKK